MLSRSLYSIVELRGAWHVDSDQEKGNSIYVPVSGGEQIATFSVEGDEDMTVRIPAGGCILETRHFFCLSWTLAWDLMDLGDSSQCGSGSTWLAGVSYPDGTWSNLRRSGCTEVPQWDATSQCYISKCIGTGSCGVTITEGGTDKVFSFGGCDGQEAYRNCAGTFMTSVDPQP